MIILCTYMCVRAFLYLYIVYYVIDRVSLPKAID